MQCLKVSIMVKTDVSRVCDYTLYYFCREYFSLAAKAEKWPR